MPGVAKSHGREPISSRPLGGDFHRLLADDLPKPELAVSDDQRAAIADHAHAPIRANLACPEPIDVFRNADDPVRVVAHEARIDEMRGDDVSLPRLRPGRDEDGLYEGQYG